MIKEIRFKNMNSIQLENDIIKVIVIPELGGKIASFYQKEKDFELLFQHNQDYKKPTLYSNFAEFDASGFDDAFPNIDYEVIEVSGRKIKYPDHGEVWTMDFEYEIKGDILLMWATSSILPYTFKKKISIEKNELFIKYEIENIGDYAFPCIWTMHCLSRWEKDMSVEYAMSAYKAESVMTEIIPGCEKYYINGKVDRGECGIFYPSQDVKFTISYDAEKLPYLGFWITEGGFRGDYNCALEPTNGYYDAISIAQKNNAVVTLHPGEKIEFDLKLKLI